MAEVEGGFAVDRVGTHEPFDFGAVWDPEFCVVEVADFGEFVGDCFVRGDAIEMAALDHEWARGNKCSHFGIVEGVAEVPFEDFVFAGPDIAVGTKCAGILPDPLVEVGGADGEGVIG